MVRMFRKKKMCVERFVVGVVVAIACMVGGYGNSRAITPLRTPEISHKAKRKAVGSNVKVVNALLEKVVGRVIYTKDGRKFYIPLGVRIVDYSRRDVKMKSVEIIFRNGSIISVVIR